MAKAKKSTPNQAYQDVLDALSQATGLKWSPPPEKPSLLQNGYFAETEMMRAPHLVRHLKDAAIEATGRPRAIVFERSGQKNASVNIPKEIAENEAFLDALSQDSIKAAEARSLIRPMPKSGLKPFAMPAPQALQAASPAQV